MPRVRRSRPLSPLLALVLAAPAAAAQIVNPADEMKPPQEEALDLEELDVPTTEVVARRGELREEDLVGPYRQPLWTLHRRFPTTRVYVRPAGSFGFEYWYEATVPEEGPSEIETQYEFEMGLGHRLQLDLYLVTSQEGSDGPVDLSEQKVELRYAFADWDEIWGNPTAYVEWVARDEEADKYELKLLLGGEITEGWHWGTNLVYEREISGELENEYALTAGVSRTLLDQELSLGAEVKAELADEHGDRGDFEEELLVGPSLQWWPLPNAHVDLAPLVGIGHDAPEAQITVVAGWEL